MIITPPNTTNDKDWNYGHHVHTRIMIRVESMQHGSEAYFNHRGILPVIYYISIMYVQECSPQRYYIRIQSWEVCLPKPSTKSRWPSSLRRQFQVLVRKGVGSNPTLDIKFVLYDSRFLYQLLWPFNLSNEEFQLAASN